MSSEKSFQEFTQCMLLSFDDIHKRDTFSVASKMLKMLQQKDKQ